MASGNNDSLAVRLPAAPPVGGVLKWVIQNPDQAAAYIQTVRALANLQVNLVVGGKTIKCALVISQENSTLTLPVS